jgi:subtilase family serine protease
MAMLPKILRLSRNFSSRNFCSQNFCSRNISRSGALVLAAAAFAWLAPSPLSAQATSQLVTNRLTQPVDDSARVTLKGTVHPLANAANDRGAAPDSMPLDRIQVVLKRSSAQESALQQLITGMHTPGSPSYHKWLTPAQFGEQFGASDQDIATVEAWLQSKGFSITKVNPGKQTLEMSGSVSQFRTAFNTQIHKYSVNGETHYANASDPQIPAALAPVLGGFASLNNFRPRKLSHVLGTATYDPKTAKATPQWTYGTSSGVSFVLSPADFAAQYDLSPLYSASTNGSGQTIAIINDSNINIALVNQFRTLFSLPANPPQVIIDGNDPGVDGANNPDGPNGDSVEAYLDVEWSGAVAPNATVDLVIGADTALESGLVLAAEHAVYGNIAPVLSISFGLGCESTLGSGNQFVNALWEQAAAQGITAIVSTGDSASAGCDNDSTQQYAVGGLAVSGLASTPYNVAVGGTDFYYSSFANSTALTSQLATYWNPTPSQTPSASILQYIPEQPWNNSQYGLNAVNYYTDITGSTATTITGASGGASAAAICAAGYNATTGACNGALTGYPKPAWQSGTGVPSDNVRDIPDLSLFAANGQNYSYYPVCYADGDCQSPSGSNLIQITGIGGTSASAPSFAGIMALVNQKYGPQGQADFILYPLAAQFPAAFHDVTAGNNSVPCAFSTTASSNSPNCIAVTNPITVTPSGGTAVTEGQLGIGTTPGYNATAGYDLATGLGTIDANQLVSNWNKVTLSSSTITLTSPTAGATFTHGQSVTFTGTVAGSGSNAPTGNVAIETDSTEPVQQGHAFFALSSGAFNGTSTLLPGGTYNVWANYPGDSHNAAETSAKTQITVSPEASGIFFNVISPQGTLPASGTTNIDYGTQLVLSAEVAPSSQLTALQNCQTGTSTCPSFTIPTGTITFSDSSGGSNLPNTAVLNAEGDAEFNAPFAVGSHTVTAKYSADASYNASTSSTVSFTVIKDTPTLGLSAANQTSSGQYVNGQPTVFNIQVANGAIVGNYNSQTGAVSPVPVVPPTGTVTVSGFPSGTSAVGTLAAAVDVTTQAVESVATVTAPAGTAAGNYNVTINYSGDSNYNSTSGSTTVTVVSPGSGLASTTTATTSGSVSPTTSISVTGTVTGQSGKAAPTGGILVYSSGNYITEIGVTPGSSDSSTFSYTLNSQTLFQGANFVTLQYTGDNVYAPSAFQLANPVSNPLSDFSLVPETTILTVPSLVTDAINVSSTNGFSGAVNLSCVGTGGVECSLSPASPSLTAGSSAAVTLTVNNNNVVTAGKYNVLVTGTDAATGQFIHTVGISVAAPVTTLPQGLTLTGPSGISIQNPGDTATGTLTVSPQGGLTGNTTFTCSVENSPTGVTCSAPTITATGVTTSTLTVATTASTPAGSYTAQITATQGGVTSSPLNLPITINPALALTLSNSGGITVAPGATTGNTSTISVTPGGGFTGNVTLACSVTSSPTGATDGPTCSVASTVNVTSTAAATTPLTVNTTAASTSALDRPLNKFFAVGGGIAVAGLLIFTIPARRRSWRSILGVLVFAAFVGMGIGCGGSSGSGGGGGGGTTNPGTTAGAYVVTVTGTDAATGKITGSTTVSVTVN